MSDKRRKVYLWSDVASVFVCFCLCVNLTPATVFFFHPQSPYLIIIISSTLLLFLHVSSTHSLALCFPLSRSINKRVVIINNWPGITVTPFDSIRWMPSWEWWVCMCECERKQKKTWGETKYTFWISFDYMRYIEKATCSVLFKGCLQSMYFLKNRERLSIFNHKYKQISQSEVPFWASFCLFLSFLDLSCPFFLSLSSLSFDTKFSHWLSFPHGTAVCYCSWLSFVSFILDACVPSTVLNP